MPSFEPTPRAEETHNYIIEPVCARADSYHSGFDQGGASFQLNSHDACDTAHPVTSAPAT
jgi:hypothetical protein